jgi:signal transduction histidine kinase
MLSSITPRRRLNEYSLSTFVLIILVAYSYARVFEFPYIGFDFNPRDGTVTEIFSDMNESQALRPNDRLLQVDAVRWEDYRMNIRQPLFGNVRPGDTITLLVQRGDQEVTVFWEIPHPNAAEIADRFSTIWLPYIFWIAGTATLFHMRPKDLRWRLLIAFNYLTALWLVVGLASFGSTWNSAIFMRALVWLCVPVYIHLHWVFPRPLGRIPMPFLWGIYLVGAVLAGLEWFQLVPPTAYIYGFALALVGSVVLLFVHSIAQPDQRRDLRVLAIAGGIIILPTVVIGTVAANLLDIPLWFGWGALLSLPALPGAYFYLIHRRQLGGLELRANRVITLYIFLILLFVVSTLVVLAVNLWIKDRGVLISIELALALLAGLGIAITYNRFQRWVERHVLGMPLAPTHLLETYSSRITTSLNAESLVFLLRDEILPSLLVRQSALLWLKEDHLFTPLYLKGVGENQLPILADIPALIEQPGKYRSLSTASYDPNPHHWIRLVLPLTLGEKLIGFWLLGRRDPDDWYSQGDILVLQSIANQTAIALVNIAQAERLHALYRANMDRQEVERARLARGIHDTVLNHLALLATSPDGPDTSKEFQEGYQKIVTYLREVIQDLRPAMLAYGLRPALEELADELSERGNDSSEIRLDIPQSEARYNSHVEQHLFRIVQQACENAIHHAQAKTIRIQGYLEQAHLSISVIDDGAGFAGNSLTLDQLLIQKHYGLVGMHERAALIGAELKIDSAPGVGTQVSVNWSSDKS